VRCHLHTAVHSASIMNTNILTADPRKPVPKIREPSAAVRRAVDLMVYEGHHRDAAAKAVGMLPKSLYNAFRKHHVLSYYRTCLQVLRESARARNIHALEEVRDQTGNQMARVNAVKALEQLSEEQIAHGGPVQAPGLVIQIVQSPAEDPVTVNPLIEHDAG
jgi:hypothetical protein